MSIKLKPVAWLMASALLFASCLGSDNNEEYDFYDDAAISSFSLGTMSKTVFTLDSKGEDSMYVEEYKGSEYKFSIDHVNGKIYNLDSLPYRTDVKKVIANITSKNSGVITIKNIANDSLRFYSTSDSIDFSEPRIMRVYSQSGQYCKDYTITVNVHQQNGDSISWSSEPQCESLASMTALRLIAVGDGVAAIGTDGTHLLGYVLKGGSWHQLTFPEVLLNGDHRSVIFSNGKFYAISNYMVLSSVDGMAWDLISTANVGMIIGSCCDELYAYGINGIMLSRDGGITWEDDKMDDNASLLPSWNINVTVNALRTNPDVYRVMLSGADGTEGETHIWTKLVDNSSLNPKTYEWTYVDTSGEDAYRLPSLSNLVVLPYDNNEIAVGKLPDNTMDSFYVSLDGGITWKKDMTYYFPEGFAPAGLFGAAVGDGNIIWLADGTTGKVWKGRLNRLGWSSTK